MLLQGLTVVLCKMLNDEGTRLYQPVRLSRTGEAAIPRSSMHNLIVTHLNVILEDTASWTHFVSHGLAAYTDILLTLTQKSMKGYVDDGIKQDSRDVGAYINMLRELYLNLLLVAYPPAALLLQPHGTSSQTCSCFYNISDTDCMRKTT